MDMSSIKEFTQNALFYNLISECPILSGSMSIHISMGYGNDGYEILIEAPFYDHTQFRKKGIIVYTGETKKGVENYAQWVNEVGAFGKHNRSEHWVNRVVNEVCSLVATQFGGTVEGELPR